MGTEEASRKQRAGHEVKSYSIHAKLSVLLCNSLRACSGTMLCRFSALFGKRATDATSFGGAIVGFGEW